MEHVIRDLTIANRAKDQVIDHLRTERKEIIDQLLNASRRVGELETKLLQLSVPAGGVAALEGDANAGDVAAGTGQVRNPV